MEAKTHTSPTVATQTFTDLKHAALFVSVLINLFIFVTWLVIALDIRYANQLVALLP